MTWCRWLDGPPHAKLLIGTQLLRRSEVSRERTLRNSLLLELVPCVNAVLVAHSGV